MNILIVYETYSGGTLSAVEFIQKVLSNNNHSITIKRAGETKAEEFASFDFIIFGSPSWLENDKDGQPHQNFLILIENASNVSLTGKKFAIFGLGDESYAHFCGGVDVLKNFIIEKGGEVTAEPLKIDNFYMDIQKYEAIMSEWLSTLPLK